MSENKKIATTDNLKLFKELAENDAGLWKPNETVSVGDIRYLRGRENAGIILECIEAGTTGTEQPVINSGDNIIANYTSNDKIGHMRLIFNLAEKDEDELIALGVTYNRATYTELWNWVQSRPKLLISEEEWQAKFTETNGKFVPYYSSGNDTSTFRTPLLSAYIKGADSLDGIGSYLEAGLPNIEGEVTTNDNDDAAYTGIIAYKSILNKVNSGALDFVGNTYGIITNGGSTNGASMSIRSITFDASRSNSIYGNSETVTPESMTGIWVIKAFGIITNNNGTDVSELVEGIGAVSTRVSNLEENKVDINGNDYVVETGRKGTSWYRKWKSGWLEQGGIIPALSDQVYTVTYMLPFKDLTYYAHNTMEWPNSGTADWRYMCCYNRTVQSFQTFTQSITQKTWYACGQGA